MTPEEFAKKIKDKYPAYQNVPDVELAQKVVAKFPTYASQVNFGLKKGNLIQETAKTLLVKPAIRFGQALGVPIARSLGASEENIQRAAAQPITGPGAFNQITVEGQKQFGEGGGKQIAGDILDSASTIASVGLPLASSVVGKGLQFGAIGATSGAGEALSEGKSLEEVGDQALKTGVASAAGGVAFGLAGKGIKGLANFLGKTGDRIQTSVIKPSQADIKDGFSIETVKKYNLGGSLKKTFEKTDTTLDTLTKQLNSKLKESNASLDLNKVYENTAKKLFGNKLENFGSNTQMEGAIEKLRNEILAVSGNNGIVSIPEAQLVKRASGHFGAWTYGVPTPEATASQKVYNTFYNELKTAIENNSPEGVREINKQISKLIPVMNAVIRRIPVAQRNSTLSLTDLISLTGAVLEPRALSLSILNLASKSGTVGSALSKTPALGEKAVRAIQKIEPVVRAGLTN